MPSGAVHPIIPERFKVTEPTLSIRVWLVGVHAIRALRPLLSQVPEWMPDTRRIASLADEVEHDDISFDASANLPGQRQADCGRKAHASHLRGRKQERGYCPAA